MATGHADRVDRCGPARRYLPAAAGVRDAVFAVAVCVGTAVVSGVLLPRASGWASLVGGLSFVIGGVVAVGLAGDEEAWTWPMMAALIAVSWTLPWTIAPTYHAFYGQRVDAVATAERCHEIDGDCSYAIRLSDSVTGRDLGWVPKPTSWPVQLGDHLQYSVDPRGWLPPMPAGSLHHASQAVLWSISGSGFGLALAVVTLRLFLRLRAARRSGS